MVEIGHKEFHGKMYPFCRYEVIIDLLPRPKNFILHVKPGLVGLTIGALLRISASIMRHKGQSWWHQAWTPVHDMARAPEMLSWMHRVLRQEDVRAEDKVSRMLLAMEAFKWT